MAPQTPTDGAVVVGYDGSPDATRALIWGADLAHRQSRALRICIARGDAYTLSDWVDDWTRGLADEWADKARATLEGLDVDQPDIEIADGLAAEVLIERSKDAAVVVLGTRGRGRLSGAVLGSVTHHVVTGAASPVVVVRRPTDEQSRTLVAGVDGSENSLRALSVAATLADDLGWSVRVLHCRPRQPLGDLSRSDELSGLLEAPLQQRLKDIEQAVETERSQHPGVAFDLVVEEDHPSRALLDASERAALVVVGSRGLGAFKGMLLGSVSFSAVAHARCPVAVIR